MERMGGIGPELRTSWAIYVVGHIDVQVVRRLLMARSLDCLDGLHQGNETTAVSGQDFEPVIVGWVTPR
jgi:hypothetical protein